MRAHEFITEGVFDLSEVDHIVYWLKNEKTGDFYVGITISSDNPEKSLKVRWQKHVRRALTENLPWTLCKAIRKYGPENFTRGIHKIIKGKLAAHRYEMKLIDFLLKEKVPMLNTAVYKKK